jgi:MFS family permease
MASSSFASYFGGIGKALSVRDYRLYWIGQLVSVQGVWMNRIASGVLMYHLTQSSGWLGAVAFVYFVPLVIMGPIAGAYADRIGHRRTAIASLVVAVVIAFLMAGLTYADLMNRYLLLVLIAIQGIGHAFDFPARQVLIQVLVGRDNMSAAIALNTTTFNGAAFTGPALCAILLSYGEKWIGDAAPALAFAAYGVGSLWFISSLLRIRARDAARQTANPSRIFTDVMEGFDYIWKHQTIRTILFLWVIASFFVRGYVDLLPGIAASVFDHGVEGLGILLAASGAGALAVSLVMAVRGTTKGLPRLLVVSIVIDAIAILVFAATPNFWVATAMMVVAGGFIVTAAVGAQTLVQATVDLDYRGRVLAVYLSLVPSAQSIGAFVIGWIAEWTGLRWGVGAGAVATLLAALVWGPSIWRRAREIEAQATGPVGRGGHGAAHAPPPEDKAKPVN